MNRLKAGGETALVVTERVIADKDAIAWSAAYAFGCGVKGLGMRLGGADFAGDDDVAEGIPDVEGIENVSQTTIEIGQYTDLKTFALKVVDCGGAFREQLPGFRFAVIRKQRIEAVGEFGAVGIFACF